MFKKRSAREWMQDIPNKTKRTRSDMEETINLESSGGLTASSEISFKKKKKDLKRKKKEKHVNLLLTQFISKK